MSIKMKLVSCISAFILVLGIFIFGVLSAEQATVNLGGSISFDATDVYARVTGKVQNAQTNPTLDTLEFSATNDSPDQSSWSGLELQFDSRATDITIEVTVENLSMERELTVNVTDALATPVDNLGKTILLDGASYVPGTNTTIPVATAADASNTSKATFTITLDVLDHNKSLPSTTFDYDINLYDENSVPVVTYQPFEFEVIGGIGNEVRITSHNGFGNVVIPASFSFDTTTPVTSFIMQDFNGSNLSTAQMTSLLLGEFYYTEEGGERTKTNMLELESLAETLTFPITVEPTYRYEFDGYSEINAILLLTAISAASEMGSANNVNFYFTNDEFTEQTFTAEEFINYIMENYPDIESGPAALAPLFSTTGLTILETDPIEIGNGNIIDGTDYIVKEIGDRVFSGRTSLNSITIPESVTRIGNYAFSGCSSLTSITIPDSVKSIGQHAFQSCDNLAMVNFGENSQLTSIGATTFQNCSSLTSITIPDNVTSIGNNTFSGCSRLKSITIPNSVATIGTNAFEDCSNLTSVNFGENRQLTILSNYVFNNCSNLESISIPDSVTNIGQYAFNGCSSLTTITIPESVTSIGGSAFRDCTALIEINYNATAANNLSFGNAVFYNAGQNGTGIIVNLGANVTRLPNYLFSPAGSATAPNITTVNFAENSVCQTIGSSAFTSCSSLTSITIPEGVTSIGSSAFQGCSSLTSITIPSSVTSIGSFAFSGCSSLTSITIPGSVKSIGSYVFYVCISLTSITIPEGVTSIGERTFMNCSSLTSITIPDSVTSIGDYAFSGCSSLTSITIPEGVTSIDRYAFADCTALTEINYNATAANDLSSDSNVFYNAGQEGTGITVNIGANVTKLPNYLFCTDVNYEPKITIVNFAEGSVCESMGDSAFRGCGSLTSITIPENIKSIGDSAFYNCAALTEINYNAINANDLSEENYVFYNAGQNGEGITVNIGVNATRLPNYIFYYYNNSTNSPKITTVNFAEGSVCEKIGSYAFRGCSSLTSINFGDNNQLTTIGYYAFEGCSSLTSINIPSKVTNIDSRTFYNCHSLTTIEVDSANTTYSSEDGVLFNKDKTTLILYPVGNTRTSYTIPDSVTSIGSHAFSGCSNLTSITIPSSVVTIDGYAFENCSSLTSITIPEGITSIGNYAFRNCSSLTSITIGEGVTSIGSNTFSGCSSLESIVIPSNVTSIDKYAFSYCDSLISIEVDSANPNYLSEDGVLFNKAKTTLIQYPASNTRTSYTIPDSVTSIDSQAFNGCSNLTSITIPEGVASIGWRAFADCTALTEINYNATAANNLSSFSEVFSNAGQNGTGIIVNIGANVTKLPNYIFCHNDFDFVPYITTVNFAKGSVCESIGDYAFNYCTRLSSITIPESVKSIGERAFNYCNSLTSITIPSSVTSIGSSAFFGCSSLTSITIPDSITSIGYNTFGSCSRLNDVTIESDDIYLDLTSQSACGYLINYITSTGETVKVLKSVVDSVDPDFTKNTYLNNSSRFTRSVSEDERYYVYTRN